MSSPANEHRTREERINEILASYLGAVREGHRPNRQELLSRHPELAAELQQFFADQEAFVEAASPLQAIVPAVARPPLPASDMPTLPPEEPAPATGTLGRVRYFGDYELLEEIASGGMGVVYKARQVTANRLVALKMIKAGQLATATDVQRFRTEAEAAAKLDDPRIVHILEVGEHEAQHFFSMQLIEGGSLSQQVSRLVQAPTEAASLMAKVARAVHFAH